MNEVIRFVKRYSFDGVLAVVALLLIVSISVLGMENLAVVIRKLAVFGIWNTVMYISRVMKVGVIDWNDMPHGREIYTFVFMVVSGLIFALA
jgi:hypothetical protein